MNDDAFPDRPLKPALPQMAATFGAFLAALVLGKTLFIPWLRRYLGVSDPALGALHFRHFFQGFALVLAAFAAFAAWSGWRILRSGQFPPPGAFRWSTRPVQTGAAATGRAVVLFACALGLLACAAWALTFPARFIHTASRTTTLVR
jgi:hypothetical protein